MPIHRGPRLDDIISRLPGAMPIAANVYKTWPNLAAGIGVVSGDPSPWVEFLSAANAPTMPFTVSHIYLSNSIGNCNIMEIGVGGAGSEVAVGSCLIPAYNGGNAIGVPTPLPIIPGGSRVTLRSRTPPFNSSSPLFKIVTCPLPTRRNAFNSLIMAPKLALWYPGIYGIHGVNANVATGASWAYGSYLEIANTSAESSVGIMTGVMLNNLNGLVGQMAFATGAAGSEVVWGEFPFENVLPNVPLPIPLIVPGSTRHAARFAASATSVLVYWPTPHFIKAAYMP